MLIEPATAVEQPYKLPVEDTSNAMIARLDRLEKNLNMLQRQVYSVSEPRATGVLAVDTDALSQQIKNIRGDIEQLQYEVANLNEKFVKFSADMEMRLNELTNQQHNEGDKIINSVEKQLSTTYGGRQTDQTITPKTANKEEITRPQTIEEEYQAAYALLKQQNLDKAKEAFQNFIKRHVNHKLVGSAHYWLGEVYSTQGEYDKAVVEYLKGYQRNPTGPKAPDNLLKMGISLAKIDKRREACVTFSKLQKEFPKASTTILERAAKESKKLQCE